MNIITTSRRPGRNLRKFVRQLSTLFNAIYFVRGKSSVKALAEYMGYEGYKKLIVVTEYKGNPRAILIYGIKNSMFSLERKYLITYFRLSDKKFTPEGFKLELEDKENKALFEFLDVKSERSDYKLKDDEKRIISLVKGRECGLKFRVEKCQI